MSNTNMRVEFFQSDDGKTDLVEIKRVGDLSSVHDKVSNKQEYLEQNFPREYDAFKKGKQAPVAKGVPLIMLDGMTKRKAQPFQRDGISTIEQFADLSDAACSSLGAGIVDWRNKARNHLKQDKKDKQILG